MSDANPPDDPVYAYIAAGRRYRAAQSGAKPIVELITKASNAMQKGNVHEFLAVSYGFQMPPPRQAHRTTYFQDRIDMEKWPDRERLGGLFGELHGAFVDLHAAWQRVPQEHRNSPGLSAPPEAISLLGHF